MKNIVIAALTSIVLCGFSVSISADDHGVKTEKQAKNAVMFRKAVLQLVRSNMGPLGAMAKGDIPYNEDVMQVNALRIEQLGTMMEDYFKADTTAFEVNTDAKDSIWTNFDDFAAKTNNMVTAAQALQDVVSEGQKDNYRRAIGQLGSTCKACHDEYKAD